MYSISKCEIRENYNIFLSATDLILSLIFSPWGLRNRQIACKQYYAYR